MLITNFLYITILLLESCMVVLLLQFIKDSNRFSKIFYSSSFVSIGSAILILMSNDNSKSSFVDIAIIYLIFSFVINKILLEINKKVNVNE